MKIERVRLIDGLRGFSLFGILLANMLIFQYGMFGKDEISYFSLTDLDTGAYKFIKIVVEGSFMPIFTFLFGYSLIKLVESLRKKEVRVRWHLVRRFLLLIVLGLLHGTYILGRRYFIFLRINGFLFITFHKKKSKNADHLGVYFISFYERDELWGVGRNERTRRKTFYLYN